eukprot:jgi/Chlat1/2860/Chrsp194S03005
MDNIIGMMSKAVAHVSGRSDGGKGQGHHQGGHQQQSQHHGGGGGGHGHGRGHGGHGDVAGGEAAHGGGMDECACAPRVAPDELGVVGQLSAKLVKQRPRILLTPDHVEFLRQAKNGRLGYAYKQLIKAADNGLNPPDDGAARQGATTGTARQFLDHTTAMALAYRLSDDPKYLEGVRRNCLQLAAAAPDVWIPGKPNPGYMVTAQYCLGMSCALDWCFKDLSKEDRQAMWAAVRDKVLRPGLDFFRTNTHFDKLFNNIGLIGNTGFVVAALTFYEFGPELCQEVFGFASAGAQNVMRCFGPSGGWFEGPMYWSFASWFAAIFCASLDSALGDDLGIASTPGFRETAEYRRHHISPCLRSFNYSDSGGDKPLSAYASLYLAKKFNDPAVYYHESEMHATGGPFRLIFSSPEVVNAPKLPVGHGCPLDAQFHGHDVDLAFFRTSWTDSNAAYLAMKTGRTPYKPQGGHYHLDLGGFVFEAMGVRWFTDFGSDSYQLKGYFGPKRFQFYRLRTEGHNTVAVSTEPQRPLHVASMALGRDAPILAWASSPQRSHVTVDLTGPWKESLQGVYRGLALLKSQQQPGSSAEVSLLVQDDIKPKAGEPVDVISMFHTQAEINIGPNGRSVQLSEDGKTLFGQILSPPNATFQTMTCNPQPLNLTPPNTPQESDNAGYTNLFVRPDQMMSEKFTIAVLFSTSRENAPPAPSELTPVAVWTGRANIPVPENK